MRAIVGALTGSGSEAGRKSGGLEGYTARLPAKYAALSAGASIEFVTTSGVKAKGRTSVWFVDLLRAYDEACDGGLLHPKQMHIAKQARTIEGERVKVLTDEGETDPG